MPEEKDYVTSWVGVDLDNTLAEFDVFRGWGHIGEPIDETVRMVKKLIANGVVVKIFTARAAPTLSGDSHIPEVQAAVRGWTLKVFGVALAVTCQKDAYCVKIIDDISVHPSAAWSDRDLMRLAGLHESKEEL